MLCRVEGRRAFGFGLNDFSAKNQKGAAGAALFHVEFLGMVIWVWFGVTVGASLGPERIAFDEVHLIERDTHHSERLACVGLRSIRIRLKAIRSSPPAFGPKGL